MSIFKLSFFLQYLPFQEQVTDCASIPLATYLLNFRSSAFIEILFLKISLECSELIHFAAKYDQLR